MDYDGSNIVPISENESPVCVLDTGNHNIIYSTKDTTGIVSFYKFTSEF